MADRETLAVYAARAAEYAKRFGQTKPDLHLLAFLDALPEGGRVLDLGCGTGKSTAMMKAVGFEADGMDASPEMAAIAAEQNDVDVQVAAFDQLEAEELYDGVYANFSLLHAPKSEISGHLLRISRALKTGGHFHIGLKTGKGEARDKLGRFYAYYSDAEITRLLNDAGFDVLHRSFGAEAGLDGTVAPWIVLLTRKVR